MATRINAFLPPAALGTYAQAHPYGPGSGSSFFPDLQIDVQGANLPNCPAIAVCDGLVRMIQDVATPNLVTLVLLPRILPTIGAPASDLRDAVGGSVCFVYRNLAYDDTTKRMLQIVGKHTLPDKKGPQARWNSFAQGESFAPVAAGERLGLPFTNSSGVGQLRFEIIFQSMLGLAFDTTLDETKRLLDPANKHRRIDPTTFFKGVKNGRYPSLTLASSDATSSLWPALTDRLLVEFRDEYDRPYDGVTISYQETTGASSGTFNVTAAQWGHKELTGPHVSVYSFSRAHHIFATLPSGTSSQAQPAFPLIPPDHVAVQGIFMADVDDALNWFKPNYSPTLPRFSAGNIVEPLVDGIPAFKEIVAGLRTLQRASDYVLLTGWSMHHDFDLSPNDPNDPDSPRPNSTKLISLLQSAAAQGASVRAMPWKQKDPKERFPINRTTNAINALTFPNPGGDIRVGFAIKDGQHPVAGSHHQKATVISGIDGVLAFVGGVDMNPDRLDDHTHTAVAPYHDIHSKVRGPAILDLHKNFVERWNNHPDVVTGGFPSISSTPPPVDAIDGTHYVQVTRTFAKKGNKYPFATSGEFGTLRAIKNAIEHARHYIYIEDQYLVGYPGGLPYSAPDDDVQVVKLLREALPRIEFLLVLIPNHTSMFQDRLRRKNFIGALREIDPTGVKVKVYYLKRSYQGTRFDRAAFEDEGAAEAAMMSDSEAPQIQAQSGDKKYPDEIYIHSKLWIVDDVYLKIGSANVNRRGFTHDTEIDIHAVDGALLNGRRKLALELRRQLWGEYLNSSIPDNPTTAFELWKQKANGKEGSLIYDYEEDKEVGPRNDPFWNNIIDPNGT